MELLGCRHRKSLYRSLRRQSLESDILKDKILRTSLLSCPEFEAAACAIVPIGCHPWTDGIGPLTPCIGHTHIATCAVPAEATCILGAVVVPNVIVSVNGGQGPVAVEVHPYDAGGVELKGVGAVGKEKFLRVTLPDVSDVNRAVLK